MLCNVTNDLGLAGPYAHMNYIIHLLHYVLSLLQAHAPLDTIYFINVQDISVENLAQVRLVETYFLVIAK